MCRSTSRRRFLRHAAAGSLGAAAAGGLFAENHTTLAAAPPDEKILGKSGVKTAERSSKVWQPVSDRKIRVGIVGFGVCQFGAGFGFQDHPNVKVAAVSDLFADRCAALARACRCEKTYPSFEEMVKDDRLEAVFVATDAPSHAKHCIEVLKHGKHVASAVPAVFVPDSTQPTRTSLLSMRRPAFWFAAKPANDRPRRSLRSDPASSTRPSIARFVGFAI